MTEYTNKCMDLLVYLSKHFTETRGEGRVGNRGTTMSFKEHNNILYFHYTVHRICTVHYINVLWLLSSDFCGFIIHPTFCTGLGSPGLKNTS